MYEAGEELCVTEQHADKPGGPQALSAETEKVSDESRRQTRFRKSALNLQTSNLVVDNGPFPFKPKLCGKKAHF